MVEFTPWPKTARLFRDIIVTEKIDGTNAAIHITRMGTGDDPHDFDAESYSLVVNGVRYVVAAQSRKRLIWPGKTTDNYGFAGWVYDNAAQLVTLLGEGLHFGEWWGKGIQRGYGVPGRSFSLFNTERYEEVHADVGDFNGVPVRVSPVPVLYEGAFSEAQIKRCLAELDDDEFGSVAAPGFMDPEGICVYHTQTRSVFKVTLDNQDAGKWEGGAAA